MPNDRPDDATDPHGMKGPRRRELDVTVVGEPDPERVAEAIVYLAERHLARAAAGGERRGEARGMDEGEAGGPGRAADFAQNCGVCCKARVVRRAAG